MTKRKEELHQEAANACRLLTELRQQFWQAVKDGDYERARVAQAAIERFPEELGDELFEQPAVSRAWAKARADTSLRLGFMRASGTPPEVWDARAAFERLGEHMRDAQRQVRDRKASDAPFPALHAIVDRMRELFASLPPEIRQHPVMRYVMSNPAYTPLWVRSSPVATPPLTKEERAELKRWRIYQWSEDARPSLHQFDLRPASEADLEVWLDDELTIERHLIEVVETHGGQVVSLYWLWTDDGPTSLLLTMSSDGEGAEDRVMEELSASGLYLVERMGRLLTAEDLAFSRPLPLPLTEIPPLDELDDEERAAFLAWQERLQRKEP